MTTFLQSAPVACTAVLSIDGLPRSLRLAVEELMVRCIPSPSELVVPGIDPMDACWFTKWERSGHNPRLLSARQVLTGTPEELECFVRELSALAVARGFQASLRVVD